MKKKLLQFCIIVATLSMPLLVISCNIEGKTEKIRFKPDKIKFGLDGGEQTVTCINCEDFFLDRIWDSNGRSINSEKDSISYDGLTVQIEGTILTVKCDESSTQRKWGVMVSNGRCSNGEFKVVQK